MYSIFDINKLAGAVLVHAGVLRPRETSAPGEYGGVVFRYHMCGATMGSLFVETLSAGEEEWDLVPGTPPICLPTGCVV